MSDEQPVYLFDQLVDHFLQSDHNNGVILHSAYVAFRQSGASHASATIKAWDVTKVVEDRRWWRDHPAEAKRVFGEVEA